jgi:hypothetical protein
MIVNIEVIQPKIYWNLYNNFFKGFELKLNNVILYNDNSFDNKKLHKIVRYFFF